MIRSVFVKKKFLQEKDMHLNITSVHMGIFLAKTPSIFFLIPPGVLQTINPLSFFEFIEFYFFYANMMATIGGQEPLLGHPHPGVGKRGRGGDRLHRVHRGAPQTLRQRFRYSELEMDRISCHFY